MTQRLVEEVGVRPGTPGHGGFCKAKQKQLLILCRQQGGLVQENEMKAAFQSDSSGEGKPGGLSGQRQVGETREEGQSHCGHFRACRKMLKGPSVSHD